MLLQFSPQILDEVIWGVLLIIVFIRAALFTSGCQLYCNQQMTCLSPVAKQ